MLARPLPVAYSRLTEAGFRVMMRQQFWLGLDGLRKLRLQHLRNPLMVLLPCAPQQRLIGGLLDEGMLEDILALRRQPPLVDQLSVHQLGQPLLQRHLVHSCDGLEQFIRKLPPQDGA
jgi:hypothetical protein